MQASGKTIGILSAVVLGGLGLWYMTKDDEETVTPATTPHSFTPPAGGGSADADAVACSDALGCPADKPYCVSGECSDEFPADELTSPSIAEALIQSLVCLICGEIFKIRATNHERNMKD